MLMAAIIGSFVGKLINTVESCGSLPTKRRAILYLVKHSSGRLSPYWRRVFVLSICSLGSTSPSRSLFSPLQHPSETLQQQPQMYYHISEGIHKTEAWWWWLMIVNNDHSGVKNNSAPSKRSHKRVAEVLLLLQCVYSGRGKYTICVSISLFLCICKRVI